MTKGGLSVPVSNSFLSVQDALERARILLATNKAKKTIDNYLRWISRFFVYAQVENVRDVSLFDIQDYLIFLDTQNELAPRTYNIAVYALRFLLSAIIGVPFTKEQLPKKKAPKCDLPVFTFEQAKRLISECPDLQLRAMISLSVGCGLRISEITRLRFRDFNKSQKTIFIDLSKHGRSRFVPFPDSVGLCLRQYCLSRKVIHPHPDDLVFPNEKKPEQPIQNSVPTLRFMDYLQTFDFYLPGHSFHRLRHVYATELVEQLIPLNEIAKYMGHASVATTANYVHPSAESKKEFPDFLLQGEDKDE